MSSRCSWPFTSSPWRATARSCRPARAASPPRRACPRAMPRRACGKTLGLRHVLATGELLRDIPIRKTPLPPATRHARTRCPSAEVPQALRLVRLAQRRAPPRCWLSPARLAANADAALGEIHPRASDPQSLFVGVLRPVVARPKSCPTSWKRNQTNSSSLESGPFELLAAMVGDRHLTICRGGLRCPCSASLPPARSIRSVQ